VRLSFEQLSALQLKLADDLSSGFIDIDRYISEWDELVELSGWSWEAYSAELDDQWERNIACDVSGKC